MLNIILICFFVAAGSITSVKADPNKKYFNQSELMDDMVDNLFTCMHELDINPDVCMDLLKKDKDLSDKKYDNCKCFGPCVAKRMGTMHADTGKWNLVRFKELTALVENESLKNEAKILETSCQDDINTHCEAGYAILKCAMANSPMVQELVKNFMATKGD